MKAKIRKEVWAVAIIGQGGRFLLHRKEGKGLLAGLWQFPTAVLNDTGTAREAAAGKIDEVKTLRKFLQERFRLSIKIKGPLPPKEHQFTHIHATMKPFLCSPVRIFPGGPAPKNVRWIKPSNFSHYPISRAMGKIAALILTPQ